MSLEKTTRNELDGTTKWESARLDSVGEATAFCDAMGMVNENDDTKEKLQFS
jgi:hypothetical protein